MLSFFADLFQFSNIRISFRQSDTLLDVDSTFDVVAGIDSVVDENAITTLAATKTIQVTATTSNTTLTATATAKATNLVDKCYGFTIAERSMTTKKRGKRDQFGPKY